MKPSNPSVTTGQFHNYFSSEILLQQALAGLLTKMPENWGVQILQGTQELGKDLVFYTRGGFGELLLCACVVKNKRITGEVSKSDGARTILFQAQQAFDSPHTDANGRDIFVERVYIVTPFNLPPATINSIKGALRERAGQVIFVGGSELFDLFKQYWPDFLADEADALQKHLANTSKVYEEENPLFKIASQYHLGAVETSARKIYVPQELHRDVSSYQLGLTITNSIPKSDNLSLHWRIQTLRAAIKQLNQLKIALNFLDKWGYVDRDLLNGEGGTLASIDSFSSLLEGRWLEGVRRKYKVRPASLRMADKKAVVRLYMLSNINKHASELEKKIQACIKPLTENIGQVNEIITSSEVHGVNALSDESFQLACRLDDCAHSAPDGVFKRGNVMTIKLPRDILDNWAGSLMIVGAAGFGKTSFCRWHALQDVEKFNTQKSDVLPIYHPLHRFSNQELSSFEEAFLSVVGRSALLTEGEQRKKARGQLRLRIYLDGLDEIPSIEKRQELIDLVRRKAWNSKKYQIVLTARDFVRGPWLEWLPRVHLSGFGEDEVLNLVTQWFSKSVEEAERFMEQLRSVPALSKLMRTPLLATLIILVFRQTGRLPENKARLYGIFTELMSGGWDLTKGFLRESKFGQAIKEMVLTTLARTQHMSERREFGDREIVAAMEGNLFGDILNNWEMFRDELVVDGLISRSADVYQFSHLSFQEFLTAKSFISDLHPSRVRKALTDYLGGNDWWREVLHFYIGLIGKPKEITDWLTSEIDSFSVMREQTYSLSPEGVKLPPERNRINYLLLSVKESYPAFSMDNLLGIS
jgi:NACHT domain-containing protein